MNQKIYGKFLNTVRKNALLEAGDNVVIGLSGGADSVCILLMLKTLSERGDVADVKLTAMHFNHGIRGDEADSDEAFCSSLCAGLGVDFVCVRGDVPSYATEKRISLEEAARELRYNAFYELSAKLGNAKIAVAHNLNDKIETVFHNIARGTSLEGLKGIAYKRDSIIRPLLDVTRREIEQVCAEEKVSYVTDSTNTDNAYTRNRIRNDVLPYLEQAFDGEFADNLLRLSELAAEDNEYIKSVANDKFSLVCEEIEAGVLRLRRVNLEKMHPSVAKRIIRKALSMTRADGELVFKDFVGIDRKMTERVYEYVLKNKGGGYVDASHGVICTKKGNDYFLGDRALLLPDEERSDVNDTELCIVKKGGGIVSERSTFPVGKGSVEVSVRLIKGAEETALALEHCKKSGERAVLFDYNKLTAMESDVVIRTKREGDRIVPINGRGGKPLRRFFTDRKVGVAERAEIPIIAAGSEVLHVFYLRRSNIASVHGETRCAIMIEIE